MRKLGRRGVLALIVAGCLVGAASAAPARPATRGTWMAGPGCGGRVEWLERPSRFQYFCNGAAFVERARWRHWGRPRAFARAVLNEAVPGRRTSVAAAPRRRSAVSIVVSRLERCRGRRFYRAVAIRYEHPRRGARPLIVGSYLPRACS